MEDDKFLGCFFLVYFADTQDFFLKKNISYSRVLEDTAAFH